MIKTAFIRETPQAIATADAGPGVPRGHCDRALTGSDIVQFGRCPWRWRHAPDPEEFLLERGPTLAEWQAFSPGTMSQFLARRPDTYEALVLECPKCRSKGPAKSCTKCGTLRKNTVVPRPWNSQAKPCAKWVQEREAAGKRIIPPGAWDAAVEAGERVAADRAVADLVSQCDCLRLLEGSWTDEKSGLQIPLQAWVTLVPRPNSARKPALVSMIECRNADPTAWEPAAWSQGLHIRAALAMALWNATEIADVQEFLWIVVEREAPHLVARRRASAELLAEGRDRLTQLLAAYAQCLVTKRWPRFETESEGVEAWTVVALQPWLTNGSGPAGGYFAPAGVAREEPSEVSHGRAA